MGSNAFPETDSRLRAAKTQTVILDYLPAGALLFAGLAALSAAWFLSGKPSGQYLVVTGPASSLADSVNLVTRAGGRLAATGSFSNVLIAGSSRPGFVTSLHRAGAWLAVPVPPVAGCGAPSSQELPS